MRRSGSGMGTGWKGVWHILIKRAKCTSLSCVPLPPRHASEDKDDEHGVAHDCRVDDAVPRHHPYVIRVRLWQEGADGREDARRRQLPSVEKVARALQHELYRREHPEQLRRRRAARQPCARELAAGEVGAGHRVPCQ